ncbi:MAG: hypothetical protein VX438_04900 [Planctomycetota bacterium]|nr:hypothetical protein [Planctomycetota bacterium]
MFRFIGNRFFANDSFPADPSSLQIRLISAPLLKNNGIAENQL